VIEILIGEKGELGISSILDGKTMGTTLQGGFDILSKYMREEADELGKTVNILGNPFLLKDREQRRLVAKQGEVYCRYKLAKKDGSEFEVLT
jgi:hypothetical protein